MRAMNIIREPNQEINQVTKLLREFRDLTGKIAVYTEEEENKGENDKSMIELPNYCSYSYVQFWGSKFPQELSRSSLGFIMRRKY